MEKELGITKDELDRALEDLGVEDDLDADIPEGTKATYEVWLLGYDEELNATDFEVLLDDGYTEQEEAKKCFDYFATEGTAQAYLENKGVKIPEDTKHVHLMLEFCYEFGPDMSECQDILDEVAIF